MRLSGDLGDEILRGDPCDETERRPAAVIRRNMEYCDTDCRETY